MFFKFSKKELLLSCVCDGCECMWRSVNHFEESVLSFHVYMDSKHGYFR